MLENLRKRLNGTAGVGRTGGLAPIGVPQQQQQQQPSHSDPSSTTTTTPQSPGILPGWAKWRQSGATSTSASAATGGAGAPPAGPAQAQGPPPPLAPSPRRVAAGKGIAVRQGGAPGRRGAAQQQAASASRAPLASPTTPVTGLDAYRAALQGVVDVAALGELAARGIPDELRATYWMLLLGYLPPDSSTWDAEFRRKRAEYWAFCEELIVVPDRVGAGSRSADPTPKDAALPLQGEPEADTAQPTQPEGADAAADAECPPEAQPCQASGEGDEQQEAAPSAAPDAEEGQGGGGPAAAADGQDEGAGAGPAEDEDEEEEGEPYDPDQADHPLSNNTDSMWDAFLKNKTLLQTIDVDLPRTMPSLHFFGASPPGREEDGPISKDTMLKMNLMEPVSGKPFTKSQQHLRRLLFLFVKLNPGLSYVQGMNEVAGHLFYTLAVSRDKALPQTLADAEADTFFMFTILMSHIGDNFCRSLDTDACGITGSLKKYLTVLHRCDPTLHDHMLAQNLRPEFYGFRWITLLLSQEFTVPDVIRIWDFFFSDIMEINASLHFMCAAMAISLRDELLVADFSTGMQKLQDFGHRCVEGYICEARELVRIHQAR